MVCQVVPTSHDLIPRAVTVSLAQTCPLTLSRHARSPYPAMVATVVFWDRSGSHVEGVRHAVAEDP